MCQRVILMTLLIRMILLSANTVGSDVVSVNINFGEGNIDNVNVSNVGEGNVLGDGLMHSLNMDNIDNVDDGNDENPRKEEEENGNGNMVMASPRTIQRINA